MKRIAAAALAAVLLQGCGSALVRDDWHAQPSHPALAAHHIEVPEKDLARACGNLPGIVYGCAVRVVEARRCIIYTGPRPAAWLMEHERKHCAGWDHGPRLPHADALVAAAAAEPPADIPQQ